MTKQTFQKPETWDFNIEAPPTCNLSCNLDLVSRTLAYWRFCRTVNLLTKRTTKSRPWLDLVSEQEGSLLRHRYTTARPRWNVPLWIFDFLGLSNLWLFRYSVPITSRNESLRTVLLHSSTLWEKKGKKKWVGIFMKLFQHSIINYVHMK